MHKLSKYEWTLAILYLLTLPLVKPWVHGDGVGYYAWARCILLQHNLDGEIDFNKGYDGDPRRVTDPTFTSHYMTSTGHYADHFTIGPAILWAPFLVATQGLTAIYDKWNGTHFSANGYSKPYMIAVAVGTFVYGFLALWISFLVARKYVLERWAFLATLGIWLASAFPFYIYAEPSLAHVHASFTAALFVWYWDRSRSGRTWKQWLVLGAIGGLMFETYYPSGLMLLLPGIEIARSWWTTLRDKQRAGIGSLLLQNFVFAVAMFVVLIPTFITKKVIYGSYFHSGYDVGWYLNSPAFWWVCFSARGVFGWNPILLLSAAGLVFLRKTDKFLSGSLLLGFFALAYLIGCYQYWYGTPSFGNRYMISPVLIYVVGLAAFLDWLGRQWGERRIVIPAAAMVGLFIVWNVGLMFQFATRLLPYSYETTLKDAAYNQIVLVPRKAVQMLGESIARRMPSSGREGGIDVQQAK